MSGLDSSLRSALCYIACEQALHLGDIVKSGRASGLARPNGKACTQAIFHKVIAPPNPNPNPNPLTLTPPRVQLVFLKKLFKSYSHLPLSPKLFFYSAVGPESYSDFCS